MTEFPLRQIGHTGLQVTELGLGCATLGGSQIAVARAAAEEIVGAAWAAGVRYVDTAPYYGVAAKKIQGWQVSWFHTLRVSRVRFHSGNSLPIRQ